MSLIKVQCIVCSLINCQMRNKSSPIYDDSSSIYAAQTDWIENSIWQLFLFEASEVLTSLMMSCPRRLLTQSFYFVQVICIQIESMYFLPVFCDWEIPFSIDTTSLLNAPHVSRIRSPETAVFLSNSACIGHFDAAFVGNLEISVVREVRGA
jgi:hypothetical protein